MPGTVSRITEYGAFARLEGDVEGLVHVSELSEDERPPSDVVSDGDAVQLRVIRIDPERKRIGLSLRRAGPEYDAEMTPEALAEMEDELDFDEVEVEVEATNEDQG